MSVSTKFPDNVKELIEEIEQQEAEWDEVSQFVVAGIDNLSVADLATLKLYASSYITSGGMGFPNLMKPLAQIKDVLDVYEIKAPEGGLFQ